MLVCAAACSPAGTGSTSGRATPSATAATPSQAPPGPTVSPEPRPACATFQAQPPAAAGVAASAPVLVWASGLTQPDDILADADGAIYVGELGPGRIVVLNGSHPPAQGLARLPVTVPLVEGLARIGDVFYAADQANDRIVSFRIGDASPTTFLQLRPVAGQDGVDSIAAGPDTVIVPDSPRGVVLLVGTDGSVRRTIGGFARPTGAWPLGDGTVLVADENAGSIVRIGTDGSKQVLLTGLPLADDVAADAEGNVFAISITRQSLVQVVNGAAQTLAGALAEPQGLAIDPAGNLLVTEFQAGRLDLVLRSFKALPGDRVATLQRNQGLCVHLMRAPGFAAPVSIDAGGGGYSVIRQPGVESQGEVQPAHCASPPCLISIRLSAGDRIETVVAAYQDTGD